MNFFSLAEASRNLRLVIGAVTAAFACLACPLTSFAQAVCLEDGGKAQCRPGTPLGSEFKTTCDDWGPYVARMVAWCTVSGGSWNGDTCVGGGPTFGLGAAFEHLYHNSCQLNSGPGTSCTNYNCNCTSTSWAGIPTLTFNITSFSGLTYDTNGQCAVSWGPETIVDSVGQDAGCSAGGTQSTTNGNKPCEMPPPPPPCRDAQNGGPNSDTTNCHGNPVVAPLGVKEQREVDYQDAGLANLSFVRYYNSGGFFDLVPRALTNTDVWRHSYSASIVPFTGNAYVMAVSVRPEGVVRYFDLSGAEMQNNDGAGFHLQKVVDGGGAVTGWILTTASSDTETYDASGRLVSMTTRAGVITTLAYNAQGQLTTVTDPFGRSVLLAYDGSGRLSTLTDPASRTYTYGYDSMGRLTGITYPDGKTRAYLYEDTRFFFSLSGIVDERGIRLSTYTYDNYGRVLTSEHAGGTYKFSFTYAGAPGSGQGTVVDPFGNSENYTYTKIGGTWKFASASSGVGSEGRTYDAAGNLATSNNFAAISTQYTYDAIRNLQTSRTEASGTPVARTITTAWHPTYRVPATITEPSGVSGVNLVTTFTYDAAGNLTKKNMTAGTSVREWNYTYNARGQALTMDGPRTDVSDVATTTYYSDTDPCAGCRGQVATVTNAAGHVTTFDAYALDGRPTQIADANGVVTTLTYKPRGWLESRSAAGETTTFDYDATGNVSKVTLPDGSWVSYQYDNAERMIGVDDVAGNSIDYQLDVQGNRVQENVYDPQQHLSRTLQRVYDVLNRLQRELGASGQTTQYTYDQFNDVTSVSDPLFHVTTNTYDALHRLTNLNDPANGNTVFTYDAKDHLKTVKDPKITATTTYNYDGLGNLTSQVSPDTGTTAFTYDAAGNVATQTDARNAVTTYAYDALNRVTAATVTDGTVAYEYDNTTTGGPYARGRLTKVTDPSGNTTYGYDALGRVTSKAQTVTAAPTSKTFTVGYSYANGRQTGITYPSGRAVSYGFDVQGHIASITVDGTTSVLASGEYFPFGPVKKWVWGNGEPYQRTFDLDGRVSTLTLGPSSATYPDLAEAFTYDSLNRLINANLAAGQAQSFAYDANGNRTNATINAVSTTYTYPSTSHRLTSLSGGATRSFTYDNAGNVATSAGITYTYDGRGRMKQAGTSTYAINGLGQRVKKNNGGDTFFAYDEAGHLIGEYDSTGAPVEETVWLGDLPVAVLKPKTGGFDVFYVWADHLGTPRQITDTTNQSRWEWPNADPFGNNVPNENPSGLGTFNYNLRFPGQYYDSEKGSNYNYFRDYDPSIGRYIESDPIGLYGGLNTFAYVKNRPLMWRDPNGLESVPMGGGGGAALPGWLGDALGTAGRLCSANPIAMLIFAASASNQGDACSDDPSKKRPECKAKEEDRCKEVLKACREECHLSNNDFGHGPDVPGKIRRCIRSCMERQNCHDF